MKFDLLVKNQNLTLPKLSIYSIDKIFSKVLWSNTQLLCWMTFDLWVRPWPLRTKIDMSINLTRNHLRYLNQTFFIKVLYSNAQWLLTSVIILLENIISDKTFEWHSNASLPWPYCRPFLSTRIKSILAHFDYTNLWKSNTY